MSIFSQLRHKFLPTALTLAFGCGLAISAASATAPETAQVLEQCRAELEPRQPVELRRRAALVVGKYLDPAASALLAQCLHDPDAVVRRNALVSIGEERFHLRQNHLGVLNALGDPEVNIRRLASSLLDEVLPSLATARRPQPPAGPPGSRPPVPALAVPLEAVAEKLNQALCDEDEAVRQNVLTALQSATLSLSGKALLPFLESESPTTVILAIAPYLHSDTPLDERLAVLGRLTQNPSSEIRLALAETLADEADGTLLPLYEQLATDELPAVRAKALALLLTFAPGDDGALQATRELLGDAQLAAESRARLLEQLRPLAPETLWPLLAPFLAPDQPTPLRRQAWQMLLVSRGELLDRLPLEELLKYYAMEQNSEIRRLQFSMLRRQQPLLTAPQLAALQRSPIAEVRKTALTLSTKLPADARGELVLDALLDEAEENRLEAIRLLASVRPPDWKQLLIDTLEEPSAIISTAAARGLLPIARTDTEVRQALQLFLTRCPDAALRKRLADQLK